MPKVGSGPTSAAHDGNGQATPRPRRESPLVEALRRERGEPVQIGSGSYEPRDEHCTASWADVRKLVAGIQWLVRGWVPYGMVTGLIAQPKVGKSAFALDGLVRPVITGGLWFNGALGPEPGFACWLDTEGSAGINVQRAADWGLPDDRVKVLFPDDPLRPIDLRNTEHVERLEAVVNHYHCRLVVVDSFRGAHGEDENSSRIAGVLQSLTAIAERTKAAIVVIHHTKKLATDQELNANSGRGSNAFLAMVRCQLAVDQPDPRSDWRRVRVLGENFGANPQPIGFRFGQSGLEFGEAPRPPRRETRRGNVEGWLRERMTPGKWHQAGELLKDANQAGHSTNTIQLARKAMGIASRKVGKVWQWQLPKEETTKAGVNM